MPKRKAPEPSDFRADLRSLAWKLLGLGYLIEFQNRDAVPDEDEQIGIGKLVHGLGEELYEHVLAEDEEQARRSKRRARKDEAA